MEYDRFAKIDSHDDLSKSVSQEAIISQQKDGQDSDVFVLDPDHPLMKKFQGSLNDHLLAQKNSTELQLSNLKEQVKCKQKESEELLLFYSQLDDQAKTLDNLLTVNQEKLSGMESDRQSEERSLHSVKNNYDTVSEKVRSEEQNELQLRNQCETIYTKLKYMSKLAESSASSAKIMKSITRKSVRDLRSLERSENENKARHEKEVEKVEKYAGLLLLHEDKNATLNNELSETKAIVSEIKLEIESIKIEMPHLLQQWDRCLVGIKKRDEAVASLSTSIKKENEEMYHLEMKIREQHADIQKRVNLCEELLSTKSKISSTVETIQRQIQSYVAEQDKLKTEYDICKNSVADLQIKLSKCKKNEVVKKAERSKLERGSLKLCEEKVEMNRNIGEWVQNMRAVQSVSVSTCKKIDSAQKEIKDLEIRLHLAEESLAQEMFKLTDSNGRLEALRHEKHTMSELIEENMRRITSLEGEKLKTNAAIAQKQREVDSKNKKLHSLIQNTGGVELGPVEVEINSTRKKIVAGVKEAQALNEVWLEKQNSLAKTNTSRSKLLEDVLNFDRQLSVMMTKSLNAKEKIKEFNDAKLCSAKRIQGMYMIIDKLNPMLKKEKHQQNDLEERNYFNGKEYVMSLKDKKVELIKLQNAIEKCREDNERIGDEIAFQENRLEKWKLKLKSAQEAKLKRSSGDEHLELKNMKARNHRLQVQYSKLVSAQEKLSNEMQNSVSRLDSIKCKAQDKTQLGKSSAAQTVALNEKTERLKRQIKSSEKATMIKKDRILELNKICQEHENNQQQNDKMKERLQKELNDVQALKELKCFERKINLNMLVCKQKKNKDLEKLKAKCYKSVKGNPGECSNEIAKIKGLLSVIKELNDSIPHYSDHIASLVSVVEHALEEKQRKVAS